jgi:hypothetical protein
MEEWMVRRVDRPRLDVREAFEPTRLSRPCLISAYTRLVPIRRVSLCKGGNKHQQQADELIRRGGDKHA